MDWVGAQPSRDAVRDGSTSSPVRRPRLQNFLNPMRKSQTGRDRYLVQNQHSPIRKTVSPPPAIDYNPAPGSPLMGSFSSPALGALGRDPTASSDNRAGTNKSRALVQGSQDTGFAPRRISIPTSIDGHNYTGSPGVFVRSQTGSSQATGLGFHAFGASSSRTTPPEVGLDALSRAGPSTVVSTGLPTAYIHGGNAYADSYAPRSGVLSNDLPPSMRLDKDAKPTSPIPTSRSWTYRREPFQGSPSFARQQESDAGAPRPPTKASTTGASSGTSPALGFGAGNLQRAPSEVSLRQTGTTATSVAHQKNNSYASSSEGHMASTAREGSAATSMTSLRDHSIHTKSGSVSGGRLSHDARVPTRSEFLKMRAQHTSTSRPNTASSSEHVAVEDDQGPSAQAFRSNVRARGPIMPSVSPTSSRRSSEGRVALTESTVAQPSHRSRDLDDLLAAYSGVGSLSNNVAVPTSSVDRRLQHLPILSPVAPSTSTVTGDATPIDRRPTADGFQGGQATHVPLDRGIGSSTSDRIRALSISPDSIREDAQRRYLLLQQLHLEEVAAHAPYEDGSLDTKNGCERVLMPRPTLRTRPSLPDNDTGYHSDGTGLRSSSNVRPNGATFERYRPLPRTEGNSDPSEASRAQAALNQHNGDVNADGSGARPFFHHRLPPATPHDDRNAPDLVPYIPGEPPVIPKRTSSRRGHRKPRREGRETAVLSDGDEGNQSDTDVATVLAQGRALDEERQRWREQYFNSIGAVDRSGRGRTPLSVSTEEQGKAGKRVTIRQSHSSPHSHRRAKHNEKEAPPPVPDSPLLIHCMPRARRAEDTRPRRSKSVESLQRLRANAIAAASALAAPCLPNNRKRAKSMVPPPLPEKDKGKGRAKDTSDLPASNDRSMEEKSTSPGLGSGPLTVRHPSWVPSAAVTSEVMLGNTIDHFGAAISTPRPDLGSNQFAVGPEETLHMAGAHATKKSYHRPSSSDELAAILSHVHGQDAMGASSVRPVPRKALLRTPPLDTIMDTSINSAEATAELRRRSLGMSRYNSSGTDTLASSSLRLTHDSIPPVTAARMSSSLPVPPRRARAGSTATEESAPSEALTGTVAPAAEPPSTPPLPSTSRSLPSGAGSYESPSVRLQRESYAHPGAFQTPQMIPGRAEPQPARGSRDVAEAVQQEQPAAPNSTQQAGMATVAMMSGSVLTDRPASYTSQPLSAVPSATGDPELDPVSHDSAYSTVRPSIDVTSSPVSNEVQWNTDEHGEETFKSLFFRPPPIGEASGQRSAGDVQDGTFLATLPIESRPPSLFADDSPQIGHHEETEGSEGSPITTASIAGAPMGRRLDYLRDRLRAQNLAGADVDRTSTPLASDRATPMHGAMTTIDSEGNRSDRTDMLLLPDDISLNELTHEMVPMPTMRPRIDSFAASVSVYSGHESGTPKQDASPTLPGESGSQTTLPFYTASAGLDEGQGGYINFTSSPHATQSDLSLPDADKMPGNQATSTSGSALLAPPVLTPRSMANRERQMGRHASRQEEAPLRDPLAETDDELIDPLENTVSSSDRPDGEGNLMHLVRSRVWPTPPVSPMQARARAGSNVSASASLPAMIPGHLPGIPLDSTESLVSPSADDSARDVVDGAKTEEHGLL